MAATETQSESEKTKLEAPSEAEGIKQPRPSLDTREIASLRVRRRIAARRPKFRREESWRYAKLAESWRRPRGGTSKVRLSRKGWPARVKVGYRGPKAVRGLHTLGFREVLVHSESELQKLDREREAVRIAHTVGARRRASIVEGARSLGLKVLNPGLVEAEAEMAGEEKQEA